MSKIYLDINMIRLHTNLNISSKKDKLIKIKSLSNKRDKHIRQAFFSSSNGISSAVIKCSNLPQALIEYEIYKGSIQNLEGFLPQIYGQWQDGELYWIVMEVVNILPKSNSFKSQKGTIELVAKLHAQFPEDKINAEFIPNWSNFNSKYLKGYFAGLEKQLKNKNLHIEDSYKRIILSGIRRLPKILEQTKTFSHTLIHGDVHRINTGLNSSNDIVFIDWENAQIAPSAFDIVWLLERSLAYQSPEQEKNLRKWGISTYLKELEKQGVTKTEETFLLEYKIMYIYLVLTSFIWNYAKKPAKITILGYHLKKFNCWADELNLL